MHEHVHVHVHLHVNVNVHAHLHEQVHAHVQVQAHIGHDIANLAYMHSCERTDMFLHDQDCSHFPYTASMYHLLRKNNT